MSTDNLNVALLGQRFMGKAHSNAFRKIAYMTWPPPLMPRLVAIAGRYLRADEIPEQHRGRAVQIYLEGDQCIVAPLP